MTIALLIIIIVFMSSTAFLLKELLKKFHFWKKFQNHSRHQFHWHYTGNKKPGMYTIRLSSNQDFHGLVGFNFSLFGKNTDGYDVFGYIESKEDHACSISLYLGNGPCTFIFLFDHEGTISIEVLEMMIDKPDYSFFPHCWQRLGIFS